MHKINVPLMQRGFRGKIYPKNAKINRSKTVGKSIISGKNKFFLRKWKKSVAKNVRLIVYCLYNERESENDKATQKTI